MMENFVTETVKMCAYLNAIVVAPIALAALSHVPAKRRMFIAAREVIIVFVLMLLFVFAGDKIIGAIGLKLNAILFGGGIVLLHTGFQILYNDDSFSEESPSKKENVSEPFVIPIAIPLFFGPAAMSAILALDGQYCNKLFSIQVITSAWLISAIIFLVLIYFGNMIDKVVFEVFGKIGGLIIVFLASQMVLTGLTTAFGVGLA